MAERKSLSRKIRFEVFKRDSFTCQYCGCKAPDVILEVDHINPVAKGGKNDLMNLVTSCFDCNRGKSDKKLSDMSAIEKQRNQIEELNLRRQQLEMMLEWRDGIISIEEDKYNKAIDYWNKKWEKVALSETGEKDLSKLVKKFGLISTLDAIDKAVEKYKKDETAESSNYVFDKIGGILYLSSKPPIEKKLAYIKGICKNRFAYFDAKRGSVILNNYVEALRNQGWSDEQIESDLDTEMTELAKEARNWSSWRNQVNDWITDINNWE